MKPQFYQYFSLYANWLKRQTPIPSPLGYCLLTPATGMLNPKHLSKPGLAGIVVVVIEFCGPCTGMTSALLYISNLSE